MTRPILYAMVATALIAYSVGVWSGRGPVQRSFDRFKLAQQEALVQAQTQAERLRAERAALSRDLQEQMDEDAETISQLQADLDAAGAELDDARQRLLDAARARPGKRRGPGAAAGASPAGPDLSCESAYDLQTDVLARVAEAAVEVGRYADALRAPGVSCEAAYDRGKGSTRPSG